MTPTYADSHALRIAAIAALLTLLCSTTTVAQRASDQGVMRATVDVASAPARAEQQAAFSGPTHENFEHHAISSVLGQNGWFPLLTGAFIEDRNALMSTFGNRTLVLPSFGLTVPYGAERRFDAAQSMRFEADVILTGSFVMPGEGASMDVSNTEVMTFNTRIVMRRWADDSTGGDILVFQTDPQGVGEFLDTGVDWRAGVLLRLGIEVLAGRGVHITINDEHVFAGHDIAHALGRSAAGANRVAFRLSGGQVEVAIDNVLHAPSIASDLTRDGVVDNSDLAMMLGQWGTSEGRTDLDQSGAVDGPDLAILLAEWSN